METAKKKVMVVNWGKYLRGAIHSINYLEPIETNEKYEGGGRGKIVIAELNQQAAEKDIFLLACRILEGGEKIIIVGKRAKDERDCFDFGVPFLKIPFSIADLERMLE